MPRRGCVSQPVFYPEGVAYASPFSTLRGCICQPVFYPEGVAYASPGLRLGRYPGYGNHHDSFTLKGLRNKGVIGTCKVYVTLSG